MIAMLPRQLLLVFLCGIVALPCVAVPEMKVDQSRLLKEMVELDKLADFPEPAYTCQQFSSYDRASTDPTVLTDDNWFANGDAAKFLRVDKINGQDEHVLMDADGPGAVVRIWSANPENGGNMRFYLDGSDEPVIDLPMKELLSGTNELFPEVIAGERGKGWNAYLPIPYAKHCKVTVTQPGIYYHVNYRTYEAGAIVETYTKEGFLANGDLVKKVTQLLGNPEKRVAKSTGGKPINASLVPGQSATIELDAASASAINRLVCKVDSEDMEKALRGITLQIYFDGQENPFVETPLGDFFSTAPGIHAYQGLPLGVLEDGTMYSNWVMPFKAKATIKLTNRSCVSAVVSGEVKTATREWKTNTMYFNAKWNADWDIPVRPRQDWNFVTLEGKGVYVGNMLHIVNPVSSWWGEGDEKIYVDGEEFPSTFGTGTEDYYGYAWCSPDYFTHAYHNQSYCQGPNTGGNICLNRFHVIDGIPFTSSLKFDMEVWTHAAGFSLGLAQTSYWYAFEKSKDTFLPLLAQKLVVAELPTSKRVEGVLESEDMRIIRTSNGVAFPQNNFVWAYSGDLAIWWVDKEGDNLEVGSELELGFNVEKNGKYEIKALFTEGFSIGEHSLYINGQKVEKEIDMWNIDFKIAPEETVLGVFDLKQGENVLKVVVDGKREISFSYVFTLDYLRLTEVK